MSEINPKGLTAAMSLYSSLSEEDARHICERTIRAYEANKVSAEFDWQAWYHQAHADFCAVESRNYVLEQRIKALEEASLAWEREVYRLEKDQVSDDDRIALLEQHAKNQKSRIEALKAANLALDFGLREVIGADMQGEFTKMVEIAQSALSEARKALGEE